MILDAAAGNQVMWKYRQCRDLIHIDIEKKLTIKPTIFCSNQQTPFLDASFDAIFYDPPHFFNDTSSFYVIPDAETFKKKWQGYGEIPRYYGGDKYKTQMALLRHVFEAQKEFSRILKDDGILWLKWNETYITIHTIMHLFDNWHVMLEIQSKLNNPNRTQKQTYWICMCKQEKKISQSSLASF